MRFKRSIHRRTEEWSALLHKRLVVWRSGVESEAFQSPPLLKERIIQGYSPLGLWLSREEQSLYDPQIAGKLDLSHDEFNRELNNSHGEFYPLSGEDVLDYCETIGVHPAHLVPFDTDPRLSLPFNILQANLLILGNSAFSREEKKLSSVAIECEKERFKFFLCNKNFQESNKIQQVSELLGRAVQHKFHQQAEGFSKDMVNIARYLSKNYSGVHNTASLMVDFFIARKDGERVYKENQYKAAAQAVVSSDLRIYDIYENIFGDIEQDLEENAHKLFDDVLKFLQMQPKDYNRADVRGFTRVIKNLKEKELKLMERGLQELQPALNMSLSHSDSQFANLAKAYIEKMKSMHSMDSAEVDMKEGEWDYEEDIAEYQNILAKINNKQFFYIGRLVANHNIIIDSGLQKRHEINALVERQIKLS